MFLTLIATLSAATVQGFPQIAIYQQPQYQVQFLPVNIPERSLHDFDQKLRLQKHVVVYEIRNGGFQSESMGREVSPFYQKLRVNEKLEVEPYREVNSAFVNSDFVNKQTDGETASTIRDSTSLQWTSVQPRNNFERNGMPFNNDRHLETNQKSYDSSNDRVAQDFKLESEPTPRKPTTVTNRGFSPIANTSKIENTPNLQKTPHKINTSSRNHQPKLRINPSKNSQSNKPIIEQNGDISQNSNESTNLDCLKDRNTTQTKDSNFTLETGNVNTKPVPDTLNGTANVENAMQAPLPFAPVNVNKPVDLTPGSRHDIDSAEKNNQPGSRSGINSAGNIEDEDRWIWNVTEKVETTTPDIENRVSFDGSNCPTGKIRVADKCVDKDEK